jgi:ankyrin repeat protein
MGEMVLCLLQFGRWGWYIVFSSEKGRLMKKLVLIFVFVASGFCNGLLSIYENTTLAEVQELIKAGADVNAKDKSGWTPLIFAARSNPNPEIITALITAGADVNAKCENLGWPPLIWAAIANPNPEIITALIKAGADVNAKSKIGWTPLMSAAGYKKNSEIITALTKAGADTGERCNEGKTALDYARENKNTKVLTGYILLLRELGLPER